MLCHLKKINTLEHIALMGIGINLIFNLVALNADISYPWYNYTAWVVTGTIGFVLRMRGIEMKTDQRCNLFSKKES